MKSSEIRRSSIAAASAMLLSLVLCGCGGSGPAIAPVEGTVTLDGEPLPNAMVTFEPENGSPSMAETDGSGQYTLMYTHEEAGALVGTHTVRVSTASTVEDEDGNDVDTPERIPAKFNWKSELVKEVEPGRNTIDLDLDSDGEIMQLSDLPDDD